MDVRVEWYSSHPIHIYRLDLVLFRPGFDPLNLESQLQTVVKSWIFLPVFDKLFLRYTIVFGWIDKMDQMLPSPGFSIPSIGTPLHQPEEDQQILPHNSPLPPQRQHQVSNGFGLALPHQQINTSSSSQPLYSMPGLTPQHMLQPQTPVTLEWRLTF